MLDESIVQDLRQIRKQLDDDGRLPSESQLSGYYEAFRQRFGPDELGNLDGEALLEKIHGRVHGSEPYNSLVYWLEFKNDEEFPARFFGGIAGGNALKFGIFRRRETGAWMTGSPAKQREISLKEAIEYARDQRDQLLRGVELLDDFPANGADDDYRDLQKNMDEVAPKVSDSAWGHKYLSLLYPEKLDDYHNPDLQRYHLIKLLQVPPEGDGRYLVAGRYVAAAKELGAPIRNLTQILNVRDGVIHHYWRVGTSDGTKPRNRWLLMRDGGFAAIGWPELGDLSAYPPNQSSRDAIKKLMAEKYPGDPKLAGKKGEEVFRFVARIRERDLVLAADGQTILGVGGVVGGYAYDPTSDFPHRRPVEWLDLGEWKLPSPEGLQTTVYHMTKHPQNLVEAEKRIFGASGNGGPPPGPTRRLAGVPGRVQAILERKRQAILYGPPGTGKTHWAWEATRGLAAISNFGVAYDELSNDERSLIEGDDSHGGMVRTCTFHPSYGYEDFLEGYRPNVADGRMVFSLRDGIFKQLCKDAGNHLERNYYLVIDEINRGDIPRIFGELLTVLEKDKRDRSILLPLTGEPFSVPDNVYLIGTMNTADRSIALLDTALRRRFGFVELMPDSSVLGNVEVGGIPLAPWLDALNQSILSNIGQDARNLQIGHSFLLEGGHPVSDFSRFSRILLEDIVPLLEEYSYEDYSILERILGKDLIDTQKQQVRYELFDASRQADLVQALMSPEISTSAQAASTEQEAHEVVEEESPTE